LLVDGKNGDFWRRGGKSNSMPYEMQLSCVVHPNNKNESEILRVEHDDDSLI